MGDSCSGHCCRVVSFGYGQNFLEMLKDYEQLVEDKPEMLWEAAKVVGMAIFLPPGKNPYVFSPCRRGDLEKLKSNYVLHSCKNLVEQADGTASCGDYEHRPTMCRNYPNGQECEYIDCTWDKWRRKPNSEKLTTLRANSHLFSRNLLARKLDNEDA